MNASLLGMIGLLLTSACFSGAEASLFTLAAEGGRNRKVPRVARLLLEDQVGVLTTILFVNLIVNLGFFAATHHWAGPFDGTTATLIEVCAVLAIVIFGEILPKVLAHRFPGMSGRVLLFPVAGFHILLGPMLRPFGQRWAGRMQRQEPLDSSEAADLLEEEHQEVLDRSEMQLITHLLELGELRAGALRRPLAMVPQVSPSRPLSLALRQMESDDIPWAAVVAEDGEVQGILDRARLPKGAVVRDAMRKVPILPEVAPVANGVQLLNKSGDPFILLVDEYGMSVGIIQRGRWADTLLDRLSLSADSGRPPIRPVSHDAWEIDAALPLHDFHDRFGDPGLSDVRVDTIGGFVAEKLDRMAVLGDAVVLENESKRFHVTVVECAETRPLLLRVRVEEIDD